MKILVLGHLAIDVDHRSETEAIETTAGVFRSVVALSEMIGRTDTIIPVCGVGREEYRSVLGQFATLPGVETAGVYQSDAPTHRVHFYRVADGSTTACAREIGQPIPFERIRKHLDVNGLLINMSSGSDLSLETLDEIRMAVRAKGVPIHLDFHNLARGVNDRYERVLRPVPEWRRWAFMVDTVQGSEEEINVLHPDTQTEEALVGHLFTLCVKRLLVTRGARGATIYRNERKHTLREDIPAAAVSMERDPVGAGDVFAAAFVSSLLRSDDELAAARAAVAAAGDYAARVAGVEQNNMTAAP
jgi:sugar/nucleoside kinase (ribokinase family)